MKILLGWGGGQREITLEDCTQRTVLKIHLEPELKHIFEWKGEHFPKFSLMSESVMWLILINFSKMAYFQISCSSLHHGWQVNCLLWYSIFYACHFFREVKLLSRNWPGSHSQKMWAIFLFTSPHLHLLTSQ